MVARDRNPVQIPIRGGVPIGRVRRNPTDRNRLRARNRKHDAHAERDGAEARQSSTPTRLCLPRPVDCIQSRKAGPSVPGEP